MISVVVTYRIRDDAFNDLWELTLRSINGLLKTADVPYELIFMDNGSWSTKYAQELHQQSSLWYGYEYLEGFRQIRFEENMSLSRVWNEAIHQADGDYVMLANNDIIYNERGWMSRMLEPFSWQDRKIGIVGIQHMSWGHFAFVEGSLFMFPTSFREQFSIEEPNDAHFYNMVMDESMYYICDVDINRRIQDAGYETIQVNDPPIQPRWLQHLGHRTLNTLAGSSESVVDITHKDRIALCRKYGYPDQIID